MPFLPPGGRAWDRLLRVRAADGVGLRAALWHGGARGHVVLLSGRTEFLEKMALPAAEFVARGFAVVSLDWRGQGLSDRPVGHALKGHVGDFEEYQQDLAALMALPEVAALPGPRVLFGHSMGGAIALGALDRGTLAADALVLSAPMIEIAMTPTLRRVAAMIAALARLTGRLHSWPPSRAAASPYVFAGFEDNTLTADRAVFDWMAEALRREPGLQLAMPTLGWLSAAARECRRLATHAPLTIPALVLLGTDERVVSADAVRRAAARLGAELVEIEGARHEIMLERAELRGQAWAAVDRFLARAGI